METTNMSSKRVLLVEDEPGVRMTLAGNLELEGFEVVEAASAEEALGLLAREPVDLVLSDIRMPGMGGVSLLRSVRRNHPELPVVLMTAFTAETTIEEAIFAGVYTVLAKPFEVEQAAQLLTRAMRRPVVLVTDTHGQGAELLERELSSAGLRIARADTTALALELLAQGGTDVCVARLGEQSDSLSLVEAIRKSYANVPVIVATGSESTAFLSSVARLGAHCLRHPRDAGRLLRAVSELRAEGAHA